MDGPGIWATYRQNLIYRLPPKSYRQKGKTVYRQKVSVMLRYRPVQVRKKYRYRTPPCKFLFVCVVVFNLPEQLLCDEVPR